ncbi:Ankyrin repeat-containing domain protein [Raphanus sativus]|nr:Ankyrin repeat-containing domain protein [Raphanus sativus]
MIWLDNGLVRFQGRNGITPFLLLVSRGNIDLVTECLHTSPECIQDVSVDLQNALHLAVIHDRFEVLQLDLNYNTPLHLAAYKNDHQMMRLLLQCRSVQRNEVNGDDLTFLDILRNQGQRNAGGGLRSQRLRVGKALDLEQVAMKTGCKEAASVPRPKASHLPDCTPASWRCTTVRGFQCGFDGDETCILNPSLGFQHHWLRLHYYLHILSHTTCWFVFKLVLLDWDISVHFL